jgi:hypothetical protein
VGAAEDVYDGVVGPSGEAGLVAASGVVETQNPGDVALEGAECGYAA